VEFRSGDAAEFIPQTPGVDLALIDCEKNDYIKFFDLLLPSEKAVVVADNILSHNLMDYVSHVRRPGNESLTLQIGKGLEVTRIIK
jgi:predicted O-methyltransferase YrrM